MVKGDSDPHSFILKNPDLVRSMNIKMMPGTSIYFNKHALAQKIHLNNQKILKSPRSQKEKSIFSINKNSFLSSPTEQSALKECSKRTTNSKMLSPRVINTERSCNVKYFFNNLLVFFVFEKKI